MIVAIELMANAGSNTQLAAQQDNARLNMGQTQHPLFAADHCL